jgi:hypothetical protein
MAEPTSPIDAAVRMSRRHLMAALMIVMMLSLAVILSLTVAEGRTDKIVWTVLPSIITVTVASLHRMYRRVDVRALKAMHNDELRQASLSRAWRNGFFAMLGLQPLLALGLTWNGNAHGLALMAAGTVSAGALTMGTTLLWYDR